MRHSGAESAGYLLLLRAMISFNVKLRVAGTSTATGVGSASGAGSGPGSGTGSRSGTGTGSGSGCPSGKLINIPPPSGHDEFGVHANRNVAGEERYVAIIVTRRPDAAEMFERS